MGWYAIKIDLFYFPNPALFPFYFFTFSFLRPFFSDILFLPFIFRLNYFLFSFLFSMVYNSLVLFFFSFQPPFLIFLHLIIPSAIPIIYHEIFFLMISSFHLFENVNHKCKYFSTNCTFNIISNQCESLHFSYKK